MSEVDHLLHEATKAADVLKAHLRTIAGDDEDAIRDTIEGEIDLAGLLAMAAAQNVTDEAMAEGINAVMVKLRDRKERIEKRVDMRRAAMLAAMTAGEIRKLETPAGTLSRKAVPPSALILSEAEIPADYWKPADPKLDKRAVLEALKAGTKVPGAMLSNGGETLAVRT